LGKNNINSGFKIEDIIIYKRVIQMLLVLLLLVLTVSSTPINGSSYKIKVGWVNLLVLTGDFRTMGEQYGYLMKDELLFMYEYLVETLLIKEGGFTYIELREILFYQMGDSLPYRQKILIEGISSTSNITYEKLVILDQANIAFAMLSQKYGEFGCSFGMISSWTDDYYTILGRSFDWFEEFTKLNNLLTVVVYNGYDSRSVATIGYPGWIGTITGFNEDKLYLSLNSGLSAMGASFYHDRGSYLNELFEMLLDSSSIEVMVRRISQTRSNFANIVNIVSNVYGYSMENTPFETKKRSPDIGVLVSTNNYMNPSWGLVQIESKSFSLKRYYNLNKLLSDMANNSTRYPGVKDFMNVFEYPLQYTNHTFANGVIEYIPIGKALTIYTVVAKPNTKTIYLKIPSCKNCNWQEINLDKYFP
jgi:hypothetical protein